MTNIHYEIGDAADPVGNGRKFIIHVCNNIGKWGEGFTESLSSRWVLPERQYRLEHSFFGRLHMGDIQIVQVCEDTYVLNMISQQGVWYSGRKDIPLRYDELSECLSKVSRAANNIGASIHMPRIGCGLAGGKWEKVVRLVEKHLTGLEVHVYDPIN